MRVSRSFWRWFWAAWLLVLPLVDPWREQSDIAHDRTHSDGTTLSATVRWGVERTPGGRFWFRLGIGWLAAWVPQHILGHLDSDKATWR